MRRVPPTRPPGRALRGTPPAVQAVYVGATRELINWLRALNEDPDFTGKQLIKGEVPFLGVLFKKSPDYARAQQQLTRRRLI